MSEIKSTKAVPSKADVWTIAPELRTEIVERVTLAGKAGAESRYLQAQATHAVYAVDGIGKGRLFATQSDYAVAVGCGSQSNVSALRTLGVAVSLGLAPAHESWNIISSHAADAAVAKVARDPKASLSAITKAAKASKAVKVAKAKAKAALAASPKAPASTPKATVTDPDALLSDVRTALALIESARLLLSDTDRRAVGNSLLSMGQAFTQSTAGKVSAPKPSAPKAKAV